MNFIRTQSAAISAFIMAVVNFVVLMDWWDLNSDQLSALNIALGAFFGIFVYSQSTPSVKVAAWRKKPELPPIAGEASTLENGTRVKVVSSDFAA